MGEQGSSSGRGPTSAAVQAKLQRGLLLQKRGRLTEAERAYREVLRQAPSHSDAHYLLGQLALQTGRTQHGVDLIAQAIKLNPNAAAMRIALGSALRGLGRHDEALASYDQAIALKPDLAEAHNSRGIVLKMLRRYDEALASYDRAIALRPGYATAYFNRGITLNDLARHDEALASYDQVIALKPAFAEAHNNRGIALDGLKRHADAVASYDRAVALQPGNAMSFFNRGNALKVLKRHGEALASYDQAIALKPDYAEVHNNRGLVLSALKRDDEALASYDRALALKSDYAEAHNNRAIALNDLKRHGEALAGYDRALALMPDYAEAHNNRGIALNDLKRHGEALASYDRALALKPDYAEAYNNRGTVLNDLKRHEEALVNYDKAIALRPDDAGAHYNRGIALDDLRRHEEALACYDIVAALEPEREFLLGRLVRTRMLLCDWRDHDSQIAGLLQKIDHAEKNVSTPWTTLGITDSPALQRKATENFVRTQYGRNDALPMIAKRQRHERIRLGYFSSSAFYDHARSRSVAELFEKHDKTRFDLVAFSFMSVQNDAMRQRTSAAFDRFIDVGNLSDEEVALLARELEIDVAVDLNGYLEFTRQGIFALRAAPLQVSYFAYAGTTGADYIDYLVADPTLIPATHQRHYTERVVYLPHCYQPNDTKRCIAEKIFTRADAGLPEHGFVFCCFNNSYKITPEVFECWMRILKQTPGSIIWLFESNKTVTRNLRNEAVARGVAAARLVFAPRMPLGEHLARHRLADLFLDTLPYNAHITASDALWAGLPVLTQIGETFAGRVAASLLNAVGLPELVTSTRQAYEALAIELATHPEKLAALKRKLAENRLTAPLFDIERYTADIEAAYIAMYERYQAGLPPDHIYVPSHS